MKPLSPKSYTGKQTEECVPARSPQHMNECHWDMKSQTLFSFSGWHKMETKRGFNQRSAGRQNGQLCGIICVFLFRDTLPVV